MSASSDKTASTPKVGDRIHGYRVQRIEPLPEIQAAAFRVHSYHHEVIGDLTDLQTMQQEDLYRHYRTFYVPNNAVIAVAGDFDTQTMLGRIQELFEPAPAGSSSPVAIRTEPPQPGERRVAEALGKYGIDPAKPNPANV